MQPVSDHGRAAVILLAWVVAALWLRWGHWAPDLSAVFIAAWLWGHGQAELIYAMPPGFFGGSAPEWADALATLGIGAEQTYPYVYPPLWAALLAPLTQHWSIHALMNAALWVQISLLAGSVVMAGRLAKPSAMSWTVWAVWGVLVLSISAPAYLTILHTQPTILMAFLILWAFERLAANRPASFGALIAVAAAIKLTPALFILAALMTRSGRAVLAFAVVGGGLALASIALAGWPAHEAMLASLRTLSGQTLMIALNISLESVLGQLWLSPETLPASALTPAGLALLGTTMPVIAAVLLIWRALRWTPQQRPLGAILGVSLVIWLFGPLGWLHYFVMPLLLVPGLARLMPRPWALVTGGAVVLTASIPVYLAMSGLPTFHTAYPVLASAAWLSVFVALICAPPKPRGA